MILSHHMLCWFVDIFILTWSKLSMLGSLSYPILSYFMILYLNIMSLYLNIISLSWPGLYCQCLGQYLQVMGPVHDHILTAREFSFPLGVGRQTPNVWIISKLQNILSPSSSPPPPRPPSLPATPSRACPARCSSRGGASSSSRGSRRPSPPSGSRIGPSFDFFLSFYFWISWILEMCAGESEVRCQGLINHLRSLSDLACFEPH